MTVAEAIGGYVTSIGFDDLPETTVHSAKRLLIDSLGCAIGAFNETPIKIVRDSLSIKNAKGSYAATVLGTNYTTDPSFAAFANGTMVRYFDYNDTYLSKEPAHPSDNIFPVLAVAEAEKRNGKDGLLGIALAYEIQCRLCDSANLWKKGWDHVNYGLVSVSAAASKMMRLPAEKTAHAINIALNSHITMRQVRSGELSMWKAFSFSNAARNAVFAAILAKHGMTGPAPIFEGEMGFWKLVSGPFDLNTSVFGNRTNPFKIDSCIIKYFPAEIHSQTAIWAALQARSEFKIDDIKSLEIGSHEAGYRIIGKDPEKWDPKTRETADHSLPYIVAVALMDGKINKASFSEKRFRDRKTLEFLKKITVRENTEFTALYPQRIANEITITLNGGSVIRKRVLDPKGHPNNPMSDEEVEEKFRALTKGFISERTADSVISTVWNLEKVKDLKELFSFIKLRNYQ